MEIGDSILLKMEKVDQKKLSILRFLVKTPQRPAFCLFMFFLMFYYFTNAGWYKIGDEAFMSRVAKQIVEKGQIGFDPKEHPDVETYKYESVQGPNGLHYFKWGLGQSLIEVPFYFIHHLIWRPSPSKKVTSDRLNATHISELSLVFLCPSIISALGCVLIFWFGLRLGFTKRISLFLGLIYGLGTMVWPYSKSLMSETTLNVVVLAGVYAAVSYVSRRSRWWLVVSAGCMGFAIMTKAMSAVIVPVLISYIFLAARSRRTLYDLLMYFAPLLLASLGVQFWYNMVRYNSLWQFGYDKGFDILGFSTPLYVGLWGLFASPGKSYFIYTPVAILGLVSAWKFFQKRRSEALLFLGIIVMVILPHARWCSWPGDWAWGPRFLLVITPYLILPAGLFSEAWATKSRLKKTLVTVLVLFSLAIQVLGVTIHPFSFIQSRTNVVNQLVEIHNFSYLALYSENAFVNFSPMFSHVVGNWWLFKHIIFSYDIWSDVPWKVLGDFKLTKPILVKGNRTIPFWWPVTFPLASPPSRKWVYPLAASNCLMVFWAGLRLKRLFENKKQG